MKITVVYNEPLSRPGDIDHEAEAGVLESVCALSKSLSNHGHDVRLAPIGLDPWKFLAKLGPQNLPDVVLNLCEALRGRGDGEPHLAATLEYLGVPYTGSGPECLALVRDKARAKAWLQFCGVLTAPFVRVSLGEDQAIEFPGPGPWFIKPATEDASQGIDQGSVVESMSEAMTRIGEATARYGTVLIEPYIAGREFNVAVMALPDPVTLPIAQIEFQSDPSVRWPIVSYESKWVPGSPGYRTTPVTCPALIDEELELALRKTALEAFQSTGCRDYARIDIRVDSAGRPWVLEVNANPDLSPEAGFARSLIASGRSYEDFTDQLVRHARSRSMPSNVVGPAVDGTSHAAGDANTTTRPKNFPETSDPIIRPLEATDLDPLIQIVENCGNFRPEEVEIAREVLTDALEQGPEGDYRTCVLASREIVLGFSVHGRVPMTDGTWDLYWIAIDPTCQGRGVGRKLLAHVEERVKEARGRWLIAETSTIPSYDGTRAFYAKNGYQIVGNIPDFYTAGDGRVTYGKDLLNPLMST